MYTALLFLHFVGLALGVGTGFAQMALGMASRDLPPAERTAFMLRSAAIGKNGSVGLTLLLLTGVGMMLVRGVSETFQWGGGAFHAKLGLVVILFGVFGAMQSMLKRARQQGGGPAMAKLPAIGRVMLLLSLLIVLAAVLAFH